jgi:hypothetical protein
MTMGSWHDFRSCASGVHPVRSRPSGPTFQRGYRSSQGCKFSLTNTTINMSAELNVLNSRFHDSGSQFSVDHLGQGVVAGEVDEVSSPIETYSGDVEELGNEIWASLLSPPKCWVFRDSIRPIRNTKCCFGLHQFAGPATFGFSTWLQSFPGCPLMLLNHV